MRTTNRRIPNRLRPIGWPVSLVFFSILLAHPLLARAGSDPPDEEIFRIFQNGAEVGEERFQMTEDPSEDLLLVTAQSNMKLGRRSIRTTQQLRADPETFGLRDYLLGLVINEKGQTIRASRTADSLLVVVEEGDKRIRWAYPDPESILVLDNRAASHLALLARRIDREGFSRSRLRVVVPQAGTVLEARIKPPTTDESGKRTVELQIGSMTEILILDSNGRLESVEIPSQGLSMRSVTVERQTEEAHRRSPTDSIQEEDATPTRLLFEEETISFTSPGASLTGILTFPRTGHPIPYRAVLVVPDFGPIDRDGRNGPNTPYMELARGLAVYGIASLRFDKRSVAAPRSVDPLKMTIEEEIIQDAIAAVATLRNHGQIDGQSIVILGHGTGGAVAPIIAEGSPTVAGIVMLASSPRPLEEILYGQILLRHTRIEGEDLETSREASSHLSTLAMIDSLKGGTFPFDRPLLGTGRRYFDDYRARDLGARLLSFHGPALLLFGERDDQITDTDIDAWKKILEEGRKDDVTFRTFPTLGHFFIPVSGEPDPDGSTMPGNIDPAVIRVIADFVKSIR